MPDTVDGNEDPLALVLAATEAGRPTVTAGSGSEERALAKVEAMIALMLAAIRNHPRFVALEASWRALHRLAEAQVEAPVVVKLMPLSPRELARDVRSVQDPADSEIAALLWDEGLGAEEPFGLILMDQAFGAGPEDVLVLRGLAAAGAGGFVPVVAHAAPDLLDLPDWAALPGRRDLARLHEGPRHIAWRALRDSEEARFLALVGPRVLAATGEGAPRWVGGGWTLAARIADAFRRDGWPAAIEGREDGFEPRHRTECDPAGAEATLAGLGLTMLVRRGADGAMMLAAPTLHRPRRYHDAAATADAALAARLPWVLGMGRIVHALALRAARELHRGHGAATAARSLNAWLQGLCGDDGPLAEATAEVPEAKGHPGVHLLSARLRPRLPQGTPNAAHKVMLNLP